MAHSTTTTASHILTKYSKCYISGSSTQSSQVDGGGEWQHFVNPVLELVLDIKKSRLNNELESVRLRILWNMDTSGIKNEVLFEDLDLLAYSDIPASAQPMPSLPLKAVYRDAVVGIRYLYPIIATPDAQPAFRRFQITFASSNSALEFINSIRNVCPCKVNPLPSNANTVTSIRARPTEVARQSFPGSAPRRGVGSRMQASFRPLSPNTAESARLTTSGTRNNMASTSNFTVPASQPSLPSEDSQSQNLRDPPLQDSAPPASSPVRVPSSDDPRGSSSTLSSTPDFAGIRPTHLPSSTSQVTTRQPLPSRNNSSDDMRSQDSARPACVGWANDTSSSLGEPRAMATTSLRANSSDLPGSTPPSSSAGDTSMPPPRLPWQTPAPDASSLLSSVRDSTKLYDLSSSELEDLLRRVLKVAASGFDVADKGLIAVEIIPWQNHGRLAVLLEVRGCEKSETMTQSGFVTFQPGEAMNINHSNCPFGDSATCRAVVHAREEE
ncbi:hypothetical protein PLEOSDRAFT_166010 [Pleurotus ostreatus PC15]|uniref:Uncharacterized protein n=1 Tax=Pleurotus ostreatus (strain PC15) TaxID=1137138 RepID=A0A067P273_PLEO1|nr:hypothetical protein PLEOSDRAFT_166010 [Pleurotus ostreatus PC15]